MAQAGRHEFELDNGNKFYIRRYDPFLALEILGEVQRKFLPPLAALMEARDDTNATPEVKMEAMMKGIEMVSRTLDGKSLIGLAKIVLNQNYVAVSIHADPPIQLDEGALNRACDDVFDVIKLLVEVLRYNYEKLFTHGRDLIGLEQPPRVIQ